MSTHQELRAGVERQARAKLRVLDLLAAEGMEVSRVNVAHGLSTDGVLLDVLFFVPGNPPVGNKPRQQQRKGRS